MLTISTIEAQARTALKADTPPGEVLSTMDDLYQATVTPENAQAWAEFVAGLKPLDDLATWTP
jgi:hypothetical protein